MWKNKSTKLDDYDMRYVRFLHRYLHAVKSCKACMIKPVKNCPVCKAMNETR